MVKQRQILGIDDVAELTGICSNTLRNWEKRYGFPKPDRLGNGYRSYTGEQVVLLKRVDKLIKSGFRIGDLVEKILSGAPLPTPDPSTGSSWQSAHIKELCNALFSYNQTHADKMLSFLVASIPPEKMLEDVYFPLFLSIGEGWAQGAVSVAQEHFATAYLRNHLAPHLTMGNFVQSPLKTAVCATPQGELHEGGLMLLTAHLRMHGWDTYYLGASVPTEEFDAVMKHTGASVLCLSFSDVRILTTTLSQLAERPYNVCIGGRAVAFLKEGTIAPENITFFRSDVPDILDAVEIAARRRKAG